MLPFKKLWIGCLLILSVFGLQVVSAQDIIVTRIASGLNNPRGVAVMPDGRLLVVEAGLGDDIPGEPITGSGSISIFEDLNADGDYDDEHERRAILTQQASYNARLIFRPWNDEVFGLGDIVLLDDRILFTKFDPYSVLDQPFTEVYEGDVGIFEIEEDNPDSLIPFLKRPRTLNAFAYDASDGLFFVVESGFNRMISVTLDGEAEVVTGFDLLTHNQEAVPAGLSIDPRTGDVLIALFSGFVLDYYDTGIAFMPGDSKIVRFNPTTGIVQDEIIGLTTAVDVTTDPEGNIYVVELTTTWSPAPMPRDFNLYDPLALPDPGGYVRFTGRVTMYLADGSAARILAEGLDTPTNITFDNGRLYVSTGLGTPRRSIITPDGNIRQIEGVIYLIEGF